MSKKYNHALDTLISIHTEALEDIERKRKYIEESSVIKVVPMALFGRKIGEPFEIVFYSDSAVAIQNAMLAHFDILKERSQRSIDALKSDAELIKVFREHRGGLAESLATTIECPNGLEDIKKLYEKDDFIRHFLTDIQITETFIPDDRLPPIWKGGAYNIIGRFSDCDGYAVIGQCNFKK